MNFMIKVLFAFSILAICFWVQGMCWRMENLNSSIGSDHFFLLSLFYILFFFLRPQCIENGVCEEQFVSFVYVKQKKKKERKPIQKIRVRPTFFPDASL